LERREGGIVEAEEERGRVVLTSRVLVGDFRHCPRRRRCRIGTRMTVMSVGIILNHEENLRHRKKE
jgi:hypothetical protein